MRLAGRTALITGAGGGIGREIAIALAAEGALSICVDRDADSAEQSAAAVRARGGEGMSIACDVTNEEEIARSVAFAVSRREGLDILVNGAGIMRAQPVLETTRESMRTIFDVNVFGLLAMLQAGAQAMIAGGRGGRIVNLASIAGRRGNAGSLQYCASKAAVISITQSSALELAGHGITVNAIAPGYIRTPMWDEIHRLFVGEQDSRATDEFDRHFAGTVASGRLGTPADIAGAAVFLASDEARYIVGQTLNVDGGIILS